MIIMNSEFLIQTLSGHENVITSLMFSSDSKYLLSGSYDQNIIKWDLEKGKLIYRFKAHNEAVRTIAIAPNSKFFVSGSSDHTAKIWNFKSGKLIKTIDYHRDAILCVLISNDSEKIITGGSGAIKVWDASSGQLLHDLEEGLGSPHTLAISPVGNFVAGYGSRENINIWDYNTGKLKRKINTNANSRPLVITFSPLGKYILY
ncbi:MAG: WD40 repeat domain-containing protein, partial [Promethearchaeota archaeon]